MKDTRGRIDWQELGARLEAVAPEVFEEVSGYVREIVEAREVLQGFDDRLLLRPKRTLRRYCA